MSILKIVLLIIAAIFFALDFFRVAAAVNWTPGGFCLLVIALFLI